MIRRKAAADGFGASPTFRWRSHEISRIEGLSDAVFGFAITLLVVALEVPQTFDELLERIHDFVGFAASFALIFQVWFFQYTYFRRYGLHNGLIVWMNGFLLFVVLFYVYPLKFLVTMISRLVMTGAPVLQVDGRQIPMLRDEQLGPLMVVYGLGFAAVFTVFLVLYWHAYRQSDRLELNELERIETRSSIRGCIIFIAVAATSTAVAMRSHSVATANFSGMIYLILGPAQFLNGMYGRREGKRLAPRD